MPDLDGQNVPVVLILMELGIQLVMHNIIVVSPCVGGSKALPPCTLYHIKCVLAEQFIKHADGIPR